MLEKDYLQVFLKDKKKCGCYFKTNKQKKKKLKMCNYFIAVSISNNTEQIAVNTKSSINMGNTILDNN